MRLRTPVWQCGLALFAGLILFTPWLGAAQDRKPMTNLPRQAFDHLRWSIQQSDAALRFQSLIEHHRPAMAADSR